VIAADKKLKLVDLPQIAGLYPTRIPLNVVSQLQINLTHSGLEDVPAISVEGFRTISQEFTSPATYTLLIAPIPSSSAMNTTAPLAVTISFPSHTYEAAVPPSPSTGPYLHNAIALTGVSPETILALQDDTATTVWHHSLYLTGSGLDLGQQLYCQVDDTQQYYEVQMVNSSVGRCDVALALPAQNDSSESVRITTANLSLYSRYGEKVEGRASVQVIWGTHYDVWPTVSKGAWVSNGTVLVQGNGFRQGWSRCIIRTGIINAGSQTHNASYNFTAQVLAGDLLKCKMPANESNYLANDTIVQV